MHEPLRVERRIAELSKSTFLGGFGQRQPVRNFSALNRPRQFIVADLPVAASAEAASAAAAAVALDALLRYWAAPAAQFGRAAVGPAGLA